uniref:Uncharacterized protein n=1 Tax=Arundo donax TaxID=35708 RepID=A0A0A9FZK6_ARUDO
MPPFLRPAVSLVLNRCAVGLGGLIGFRIQLRIELAIRVCKATASTLE